MDDNAASVLDQLQTENDRLKAELGAIRSGNGSQAAISIGGIETMTLRLGADGRIEYANSAMARLTGVEKSALIGADVSSLQQCLPEELARAVGDLAADTPAARVSATTAAGQRATFQVKVTSRTGHHDVVIQDVSDEDRFRAYVERYVSRKLATLSEQELQSFKFPERRLMTGLVRRSARLHRVERAPVAGRAARNRERLPRRNDGGDRCENRNGR